jgi:hypothetical protein
MPGLVPGIHVLATTKQEDVDGRDKPGHDVVCYFVAYYRGISISIFRRAALRVHAQ